MYYFALNTIIIVKNGRFKVPRGVAEDKLAVKRLARSPCPDCWTHPVGDNRRVWFKIHRQCLCLPDTHFSCFNQPLNTHI